MRGLIYCNKKNGKLYTIICDAKHSETMEDLVVYQCLYDNGVSKYWVRPRALFNEKFEFEGKF